MKKPQCKDTLAKPFCQAFHRQYMLRLKRLCDKKCYKGQNFIQRNQILLKLTLRTILFKEKDVLSGAYNRHYSPANKLRFSDGPGNSLSRTIRPVRSVRC